MLSMIAFIAFTSALVLRQSFRRDAASANRFEPEGKLRW
jgi:hypothetical protein